MELRQANIHDLPKLKEVYRSIVWEMQRQGMDIWDDVYPCEFFETDIEHQRLWLLTDGEDIAGAFALCDEDAGSCYVNWTKPRARALYLDRLGVAPRYRGRGLGRRLLRDAAALAVARNAEYLRLFVVEGNAPAVRLYEKNGFHKAEGAYDLHLGEDTVLHEYGFELQIPQT